MRKISLAIVGFAMFLLAFSVATSVSAATTTYNNDVTLSLPNGISLTVLNGSDVESLVVNDDSTVTLTFEADSDITIRSYNVYTLTVVGGAYTCVAGGYNQVQLTTTSGSAQLSVAATTACTSGGGNPGGGGGGGGGTIVTPTNTSIKINNDNTQTTSRTVTLNLSATNATLMMLSNSSNFSGAVWEAYATTKSWTLPEGFGAKTVYAQFRSSAGGQSATINDKIELGPETPGTPAGQPNAGQSAKHGCGPSANVSDPCKAVYYVGNNGKRYTFPNNKIYSSWYADFSGVVTVAASQLASYALGGNVTYRPGTRMIKIQTDPKVYAIGKNGVLRWIKTEEIARAIYGDSWNTMIDDISSAFFVNYTVGDDIASVSDYNKETLKYGSPDFNTDKGLKAI